jgi:hypothetical protein
MGRFVRDAWPELPAPTDREAAAAARAGVSAHDLAVATDWTVAEPCGEDEGGADRVRWRLAARSHGHGRWAQFLAPTEG